VSCKREGPWIIPWEPFENTRAVHACDLHRLILLAATALITMLSIPEDRARSLHFQLRTHNPLAEDLDEGIRIYIEITPTEVVSFVQHGLSINTLLLHPFRSAMKPPPVMRKTLDYARLRDCSDQCSCGGIQVSRPHKSDSPMDGLPQSLRVVDVQKMQNRTASHRVPIRSS